MNKLITSDTLRKWKACEEGYIRFCELFPRGATLEVASKGLIKDVKKEWSDWLWCKCKTDDDYVNQTSVIVGNDGTATAGYAGTATAGSGGTATAGNDGTATAGNDGTATAGHRGTATAGNDGTATAGNDGTATAGNDGTAIVGSRGTAIVGSRGTATAGSGGTATAGSDGTATAGDYGSLCIKHWNGSRYTMHCANVGINGIKPNIAYKLDDNQNFVEA